MFNYLYILFNKITISKFSSSILFVCLIETREMFQLMNSIIYIKIKSKEIKVHMLFITDRIVKKLKFTEQRIKNSINIQSVWISWRVSSAHPIWSVSSQIMWNIYHHILVCKSYTSMQPQINHILVWPQINRLSLIIYVQSPRFCPFTGRWLIE